MKMNAGLGNSYYTRQLGHLTLYRDDHEFNINEIFETITLSGTSNVKINGNNPRDIYIFAYRADNNELLTVNAAPVDMSTGGTGAWKMTFEAFKAPVEVYFEVQAVSMSYSSYYKRADITVNAFKDNISNILIEVDVGLLTVSGTVNVTVNGNIPVWAGITMRKWEDNFQFTLDENGREIIIDENNNEVFTDWLDTYEIDFKNGNAWIVGIESLKEPVKIYFEYECTDAKGNYFSGRVKMPALSLYNVNLTNIVLDIGDIRVVTLSGTAEISVNGKAPLWATVTVYRSDSDVQIGYSWIELNQFPVIGQDKDGNDIYSDKENPNYKKWSIGLQPFTASTNVRFVVSGMYLYHTVVDGNETFEERFFERNVTTGNVYNQDIENIALNVSITPKELTLSGTVNLKKGFLTPDKDIEITAMIRDGGSDYNTPIGSTTFNFAEGVNSWSIKVMSFDSSTNVRFRIRWSTAGETFFIFPASVTVSVNESDVSGINLSDRVLDPAYTFNKYESTDWIANINPAWLLKGITVKQGEHYVLDFTFSTRNAITHLDAVMRDLTLEGNSILSDVRRVESGLDANEELTGRIVFTISKSASSSENIANTIHFIATGNDTQPILTFSNLTIKYIPKDTSVSSWPIKVNGNDDALTVVGPGITTTAEITGGNVLSVKPGGGGYYHFVLEYDLGKNWSDRTVNITITTEYRLKVSTKIAWQVTARPNSTSYPTICGSTSTILAASDEWTQMTGTYNGLIIPPGPGDDGRKLYLSGLQIEGKSAEFRNFTMTINVP